MPSRNRLLGARRLVVIDQPRRVVTVAIFLPTKARVDWACRVAISGAGVRISRRVHGVDALQAVQLAMEFARITLAATGLHFTLDDSHASDDALAWTGFPQLVPPLFGPAGQRCSERIDRCIQQQTDIALRALKRQQAARSSHSHRARLSHRAS